MNNEILEILKGIDQTESTNGWWETSIGAQFGAKVLNDILFCFDKLTVQRDELLKALEFAREMMVVNDLTPECMPRTFDVIDEAIAKAKGEV